MQCLPQNHLVWKGSQEVTWSSLSLSRINTEFRAGCWWQQLWELVFQPCLLLFSHHMLQQRGGFHLLNGYQKGAGGSPWSHLFSELDKPSSLSLSSQVMCFSSWPSGRPSAGFAPVYQHLSCSLLWTGYCSQDLTITEQMGRIISPYLQARHLLIEPSLLLAFVAASVRCGLMLTVHLDPQVLFIQAAPQPVSLQLVLLWGLVYPRCRTLYLSSSNFTMFCRAVSVAYQGPSEWKPCPWGSHLHHRLWHLQIWWGPIPCPPLGYWYRY